MDFSDTHLTESTEDEFYDTSDKILKLSDELAEEIILENIDQQLNGSVDDHTDKINYVTLFKEKYNSIDSDMDCYDSDYMRECLDRVTDLVMGGLKKRYAVGLGEDLDYTTPETYLGDVETLYEFLFIRQYDNLIDYIDKTIDKKKNQFVSKYGNLIQSDEHANDLFVIQSRKKFKNESDIVILHFLNDIIDDICEETTSAYVLFDEITKFDAYEECNYKMAELILNYGSKLVIDDDATAGKLYIAPLLNLAERDSLRSRIWSDYVENCELLEEEIQ